MLVLRLTVTLVLAMLVSGGAQSIEAQVTPRSAYRGQPITLYVIVHDCEGCSRPVLPESYARDFTVEARVISPQGRPQCSLFTGRQYDRLS